MTGPTTEKAVTQTKRREATIKEIGTFLRDGKPSAKQRRIWRSAKVCGSVVCQGPFTDGTVYRLRQFPHMRHGLIGYCFDCVEDHTKRGLAKWRAGDVRPGWYWLYKGGECEACGRKVVTADGRYRKHTFCSTDCRDAIYRRNQRQEPHDSIGCDQCGEPFTPARSDSRYCSPACRQKAYRTRKA